MSGINHPGTGKIKDINGDVINPATEETLHNIFDSILYGQSPKQILIDETIPGTMYVGEAQLGASTSDGYWTIMRLVESGGNTEIKYATTATVPTFNVWDDRYTLTYI